jgi:endogenous inhibitor of DNA gyrase (YacG/DUF329 family)
MPKKKSGSLRCPTCRKLVLRTDPDFPFCSNRCRVVDLGKWASGHYVISSPINDPESGGEAEYTEHRPSNTNRSGPDGSSWTDDDLGQKPN